MNFSKLIGASCIVMTAAFSGQAMALAPAAVTTIEINISGASAQQKAIGAMLGAFCVPGTLDIFQDNPGGGAKKGKSWKSYSCTIESGIPATALNIPLNLQGQDALFNNRSKGGSTWGVLPVQRGWKVQFMNIKNGNCIKTSLVGVTPGKWDCTTAVPSTEVDLATGECPRIDNNNYGPVGVIAADKDTKCRRSEGGVSDVEPAMFGAAENVPALFAGLPASTNPAPLNSQAAFAVVFGVSVDHAVYTALQARDIAAGNMLANCLGNFAQATAVEMACIPSMTKPEVTAVLSGDVTNWTDFGFAVGTVPFNGLAVCRRVKGSGTQASANAYFMENPCRTGSLGGFKTMLPFTDTALTQVVENPGSGGVIQCHNDMSTLGNCGLSGGPGCISQITYGSIGFNAIEKTPKAGDKWAFIKINMVKASVENFLKGKYDFAFENTMQTSPDLAIVDPLAAGYKGSSADSRDCMNLIVASAPDPVFLSTAGVAGVAALCGPGVFLPAPAGPGVVAVTSTTRGGSSCAALTLCAQP